MPRLYFKSGRSIRVSQKEANFVSNMIVGKQIEDAVEGADVMRTKSQISGDVLLHVNVTEVECIK